MRTTGKLAKKVSKQQQNHKPKKKPSKITNQIYTNTPVLLLLRTCSSCSTLSFLPKPLTKQYLHSYLQNLYYKQTSSLLIRQYQNYNNLLL